MGGIGGGASGAQVAVIGLMLTLAVARVASTGLGGGGGGGGGGIAVGAGVLKLHHRYMGIEGGGVVSQRHWERLREHDRARHGRFLAGAADFPLGGTYDPNVAGLYFTEVGLGNPSKPYIVQVDTGSDVLWVNCKPCIGCPTKSGLGVPLSYYDPNSASSQPLSCSDSLCDIGKSANEAACTSEGTCAYVFQYGDGSTAEGYYVKDSFEYDEINGNSISNATTEVVFGCSFNETGQLSNPGQAVDGIMGFGQLPLSVPSQLYSQGKAPHKFAHCLEGDSSGGGILVIGDVIVSGMQYTPIVPNTSHYNVNLLGITVNSANLSIDPALFSSANSNGAIFDSGTTLAYLPQQAYDVFVRAVVESSSSQAITIEQDTCFIVVGSLENTFPPVALNLEGATMQLKPEDYLIQRPASKFSNVPVWCIGWQSSSSSGGPKDTSQLTILGDLILKDKMVLYDLENIQIGFVDYNCSAGVNVATSSGKSQSVPASHINANAGIQIDIPRWTLLWLLCIVIAGFV